MTPYAKNKKAPIALLQWRSLCEISKTIRSRKKLFGFPENVTAYKKTAGAASIATLLVATSDNSH